MRIPRGLNAQQIIRMLADYGYFVSRQTGSHIRLTSSIIGAEHHITVPDHNDIRIGTVNAILYDVADHLNVSKDELISKLK